MSAVPRAVPSAVAPAVSGNNVTVLTGPQLGPYQPMTGSSVIPVVPRTETEGEPRPQPHWTSPPGTGSQAGNGTSGAPTVPVDGFLFRQGPIDPHYTSTEQARDPYKKVNNPPTRGLFTWVKAYANHIARGPQDVDPNGFRARPLQQRTSVMRITPPAHGAGYAPETAVPRQQPQHANTAKYLPALGTQEYGTGVLNSDTFGAGQTAGGIGGSQYTPPPGPPQTMPTGSQANPSGMPVWG